MKKKTFVLHASIAVALCATTFATPAAADEGPTAPPTTRPGIAPFLPPAFAPLDAFIEYAKAIVTTQKAANDPVAPTAASPSAPAIPITAPARAAPQARSYPRTFATYDALVDYATSIATTQQAASDRLAAVLAQEDANRAALATVFDPRVRGGLMQSATELMDDVTIRALQAQLASDVSAARELVADGAVVTPPASWLLPLLGEDTQDFGSTPYYFEPALIYNGVYYPHFHTGTDIAAPWGTPILAPARGMVVFADTMGDGAEVVVIAHDSGLVSMYAHLDNHVFPVPVKAGDTVQAGDRIGNVGLTGITTGAHLHWSVWRNGELVDPLSMIRG
ncbi:MAG TPA: M23 family metallopeptidase [Candidatus Limnocylindria bacterium]|jgi:murein DD-endopeptidase MepM/ murein hydrolase activator NlpD